MTITFLILRMKVYKNAKSCRESAEELYYPTFYHMHNHLTGFWGFGIFLISPHFVLICQTCSYIYEEKMRRNEENEEI